jgi:hypothetical protein
VSTGNNRIFVAVLAWILAAPAAGPDTEAGLGALRVAPELVADTPVAQLCDQRMGQPAELIFEMLEPDDIDADLPRLLATRARAVVDFEWNAATGELSYSTDAASTVFSDLQYPVLPSRTYAREPLNCR